MVMKGYSKMKQDMILIIPSFLNALLLYIFNLNWEFFILLCVLIILDIITGVISGSKNHKLSSKIMKNGLLKKCGELIVIFAVVIGQRVAILNGISFDGIPLYQFIVTFFCFKELLSILENWVKMGVNVPNFIIKWFKITQQELEKGVNSDVNS